MFLPSTPTYPPTPNTCGMFQKYQTNPNDKDFPPQRKFKEDAPGLAAILKALISRVVEETEVPRAQQEVADLESRLRTFGSKVHTHLPLCPGSGNVLTTKRLVRTSVHSQWAFL